jgi:hypothetical protein
MTGRTRHLLRKFFGATSGAAGKEGLVPTPAAGDEGKFLRGDATWAAASGGSVSVAVIADVKAYNADGGTFTASAMRTRDLQTEISDPDGIVTLSSNEFTLGAGTYLIQWSAPGFQCGSHATELYNVTGTAQVHEGSMERCPRDTVCTRSMGAAIVTPGSSTAYSIRHQCDSTKATTGFGYSMFITGIDSVYTIVTITKLA